jgi:hypothetical protein
MGPIDFDIIDIAGTWGATNSNWTDSDINLYLDLEETLPPVDSRWVNKITIESTAKSPTDWQASPDFFGLLSS